MTQVTQVIMKDLGPLLQHWGGFTSLHVWLGEEA